MIHITELNQNIVREIHERYYRNEFRYPDFSKFPNAFQLINDDGRVITAGGFRLIPEIVLITDTDAPVLDRKLALTSALDFMIYGAQRMGFTELHAFVQNDKFSERLKRTGFHSPAGECLVLEI